MRCIIVLCSVLLAAGCMKSDKNADTAASVTPQAAAAPTPAPLAMSDIAGKWTVTTKSAVGDTALATYELTIDPDPAKTTVKFANRPVMPGRISIAGDSVILDFGPFESVLRKGVQVTSHNVSRLQNGKLVGSAVGHYRVKTADSVQTRRNEAIKHP